MTPDPSPARPHRARLSALLRRPPLYPFEWICLLLTAGSIAFLRYKGMRIDWRTVEYTVYPMLQALPKPLLIGLGLQVLVLLLVRKPLSGNRSAVRS